MKDALERMYRDTMIQVLAFKNTKEKRENIYHLMRKVE